jgi:hypothetical protein
MRGFTQERTMELNPLKRRLDDLDERTRSLRGFL